MRRYETIFILDPDLSEEGRAPVLEKATGLIEKMAGFLVKTDEWGAKKLAYEIRKKSRGYYILLDYCGNGDLVAEMERSFRIDDKVLKYMTVILDKDTDLEKVKAEMAEAEKKAQAESAPQSPAETTATVEATEAPATEAESTEAPATEAEPAATESSQEGN